VGDTFSEGRVNATNKEISGWPATSRTEENIAKVCQTMRKNRGLTVRSIAEQANMDRETVRKILTVQNLLSSRLLSKKQKLDYTKL
jgi:predicted transcriptional regulator